MAAVVTHEALLVQLAETRQRDDDDRFRRALAEATGRWAA